MPLFREFTKGLWKENPVFVMVLGMCPTLAVTTNALNGFSMASATTFVLVLSSLVVSIFRRFIPNQVRIATYTVVIATFVTVEAFASKNPVIRSLADALGMGAGFMMALVILGSIRELFAAGTIFGTTMIPGWHPWGVMVMPAGAFITLGLLVALFKLISMRVKR